MREHEIAATLNGCPWQANHSVLEACHRAGSHYLDMAADIYSPPGLKRPTKNSFEAEIEKFNQPFLDKGIAGILCMGMDPGAVNVFARWAMDRLDNATSIRVLDADNAEVKGYRFAVLFSPVSGAFIAFGLAGTFLLTRTHRRIALTTMFSVALSLVVIAAVFGVPGPEGYPAKQALSASLGLIVLLIARPPRHLVALIVLTLVACPILVAIPNAMGSNFQRLVWIWLPVAVIATARARRHVAFLAVAIVVYFGAQGTIQELHVATKPMSSANYYTALATELDTIPGLDNYRIEVPYDGTHTAAYALLNHAALAGGYESQTDHALNAVLRSSIRLDAESYRLWLDTTVAPQPPHVTAEGLREQR
jgi:hypothetical protein